MATTSRTNTMSTTMTHANTLCQSTASSDPNDGEFQSFLKAFKQEAELNKKEVQDYETTRVDDVKAVIDALQQKHISNNRQQYMKRLEVFLVNMEGFGKVIEVFLNSTEYLAFVWGPMKFMLVAACNYSEAFNSLLDAYLQIGELLPQLQAYQQHCITNSYMRTVLALIYKDVLEFHAAALKHFRKPTWKKLFSAVWSGFLVKLREIRKKMECHRRLIESQASIAEFEEARRFRDTVEVNFREMRDEVVRHQLSEVHRWLSPYKSKLEQNKCAGAKSDNPSSGQWLLQHDRFKEWYDPVFCITPLLWLNGIPGAGKTILASTIIASLPALCSPTPIRLAYFYCKDADQNRNSFVAVARGLLSQLLRDNPDLLLHIYDKGSLKSGEAILSDPQTAKDLLEVALDFPGQSTYIIIDGIDECHERQERKLISCWFSEQVNNVRREDLGNLRCLFVSRKDGPAIKDLSMVPSIEIRPVDTRDDVKGYLAAWEKKIAQKHGSIDPQLHPLVDTILAATQGMFLFAKLAVWYLHELPTKEKLLESINPSLFPDEIGKMYEKILDQIFDGAVNSPKQKVISRLLNLPMCAKRPLRWYEIQGLFAFDPDDEAAPVNHEARKLRDNPTDLCLSLIEWHPDNSVQLVHPTARDHLLRDTRYLSSGHVAEYEITEHTLAFLTSTGMDSALVTNDIRNFIREGYYSFLDYSVAYWAVHLQAVAAGRSGFEDNKWEELTDLLGLFIDAHWATREKGIDVPISATMNDKLKAFGEIDCFPKLVQAIISARKQLSIHGKGPSPEEPLDLSQLAMSVRRVHEELCSNPQEPNNFQEFYGTSHFKCPRVNCIRFYEGYGTADERDRHVNKHERPFSCGIPDCSMAMVGYSTERALQKHMFELHGLDPGSIIDFPLPPKQESRANQKNDSVFRCAQCPKKFTRAFNLRNHMRTHQNSRPFACRIPSCGKTFARPNDRARHEGIHDVGEGRRTYVCSGTLSNGTSWGCKRTFIRADKLRNHFNTQVGRRCRAPLQTEHEHSDGGTLGTDSQDSGVTGDSTEEHKTGPSTESTIIIAESTESEMDDAEWEKLFESMVYFPEDGDD